MEYFNPQVRSNANVNASTLTRVGSPTLDAAMEELRAKYGPSFANFTQNVTQFVNTGQLDYDAVMLQAKKRFSHNYSAQVSYTLRATHEEIPRATAPRPATSRSDRI